MNNIPTGCDFYGLFAVALIVLKLFNIINWSWAIILAPLWIPIILFWVVVFVLILSELWW